MGIAAQAFTPEPALKNKKDEATAQTLFHELRCVVCEGQSLAESDATLARQMRSEIRRMLRNGQSEKQVRLFFVERYGDAILMSPPLKKHTYPLWCAPLILLLMGSLIVWRKK